MAKNVMVRVLVLMINECGGIYVHKKSRPMISDETKRLRVEYSVHKYIKMRVMHLEFDGVEN